MQPTTNYIPVSQNITFSPNGPTTHRVNITINDDSLFEDSESLTISLTPLPPHQSRIRVVGGNATIRIQDNDSECFCNINSILKMSIFQLIDHSLQM